MSKLVVVLLCLLSFSPTHAQEGLMDCLPSGVHTLWYYPLEGNPVAQSDEQLLYDLIAQPVVWLGYGEGEEQGARRGFAGVDTQILQPQGYLYLVARHKRLHWEIYGIEANRILVSFDPLSGRYILSVLSVTRFAMPDGSHYDYHIPGNCIFWVQADDWRQVIER